MKTAGIIAEYNPFHNGHQYHIEQTKEKTGADFIVVVMSGDYVQRGAPAIYPKSMRARTALLSGADLVLEMPVFGVLSAAADFALCGVSTLEKTGIVDVLSFGSEAGDLDALTRAESLLSTETPAQSAQIKEGLKAGLTWPKARAAAYESTGVFPDTPNDILGIEYLRAIKETHSSLTPWTFARKDSGYHSTGRTGRFASATAVRKAIFDQDPEFLQAVLPEAHFLSLQAEAPCAGLFPDDFSILLNHRILTLSPGELKAASGMPKELAAKLLKNRLSFASFEALVRRYKSRQDTYTKVSRCLMNLALGLTKEDMAAFKSMESAPWLRVLGFKKSSAVLLTEMKKNAGVPILTKTADASRLLSPAAWTLFEKNLALSEVYRMMAEKKTGKPMKNEFTRPLVLLP